MVNNCFILLNQHHLSYGLVVAACSILHIQINISIWAEFHLWIIHHRIIFVS